MPDFTWITWDLLAYLGLWLLLSVAVGMMLGTWFRHLDGAA